MREDNHRAQKWNRRYASVGAEWTTRATDPLLVDFAHLLPKSGVALDAGAGVGNHSVFLAQHGLRVVALDISETGLGFLRRRADAAKWPIATAVWDLAKPYLPPNCVDLIINFNFLERATFPIYRRALRPNGLIVFSTFVQPTPDHPSEPFFLQPNELKRAFAGFEMLHSAQTDHFHRRSGTLRTVEQYIGRKPVQ